MLVDSDFRCLTVRTLKKESRSKTISILLNLFSCSKILIDGGSGTVKIYLQFLKGKGTSKVWKHSYRRSF